MAMGVDSLLRATPMVRPRIITGDLLPLLDRSSIRHYYPRLEKKTKACEGVIN